MSTNIAVEIARPVPASTSGVTVILKRNWSYGVQHSGKNVSDASATGLVVIGLDGQLKTADRTPEANKIILASGDSLIIPAYAGNPQGQNKTETAITIRSASGAPVLDFVRANEFVAGYQK